MNNPDVLRRREPDRFHQFSIAKDGTAHVLIVRVDLRLEQPFQTIGNYARPSMLSSDFRYPARWMFDILSGG